MINMHIITVYIPLDKIISWPYDMKGRSTSPANASVEAMGALADKCCASERRVGQDRGSFDTLKSANFLRFPSKTGVKRLEFRPNSRVFPSFRLISKPPCSFRSFRGDRGRSAQVELERRVRFDGEAAVSWPKTM